MPSSPPVPPSPVPPEQTRWSWGLVGFYVSCAMVALGATVAAAGYMWVGSVACLVVGSLMVAVCSVTCLTSLKAARRE